jgi:hypothetical protein
MNHSKSTLSTKLFSQILRALEDEEYVLISLDLSSAFDMLNVNLLIKRQRIMGFSDDIENLIKVWLSNRLLYAGIDGDKMILYDLLLGIVQCCPMLNLGASA